MDRAERVANELLAETKPREYVNVLRREFQAVWEEAAAACEREAVVWERAFPDEGPAAEARLCADKIRARAKEAA